MLCNRGYLCDFGNSKNQKSFGEGVSPDKMEDELVGEMSEMSKSMKGEDKHMMEEAIKHVKQACIQLKYMSPEQRSDMMMQAKMMVKKEMIGDDSPIRNDGQNRNDYEDGKEGYRYGGLRGGYGGYRYNRYYPWRYHYYRNPYYTYYTRPYYSYYSPYYYGYPYGPSYGYGSYW
ncbi:hypothetical protein OAG24_01235 [bacterium]|nr:hypothetical protein [bacterium]